MGKSDLLWEHGTGESCCSQWLHGDQLLANWLDGYHCVNPPETDPKRLIGGYFPARATVTALVLRRPGSATGCGFHEIWEFSDTKDSDYSSLATLIVIMIMIRKSILCGVRKSWDIGFTAEPLLCFITPGLCSCEEFGRYSFISKYFMSIFYAVLCLRATWI